MQRLLEIMLSNAVAACVLAAAVGAVGLIFRRPAVVRALWVLVLLKLITPPIWTIPIGGLLARPGLNNLASPAQVSAAVPEPRDAQVVRIEPVDIAPATSAVKLPDHTPVAMTGLRQRAFTIFALSWTAGSLTILLIAMTRIAMLGRVLAAALPGPPSVQRDVSELAGRLGIWRTPRVWFVSGAVCPALWAFGRRPRVLVPTQLWDQLDERQRQTLLAHELAHLRRQDHWVRLLELIATVAYWWHPAVWLARRQIHDCEEQCCDAWVLWALPASARSYGTALLQTVEFVSMYRPTRPALAAGLGEFRHLKRRLLMIKQGQVARALSRSGLLAICSAAAFALPVGPTFGQAAPPAALPPPVAPQADVHWQQIEMARARVERLRAQLAMAESRLAILEHGGYPPGEVPAGGMGVGAMPGGPGGGPMVGVAPGLPPGTPMAWNNYADGRREVIVAPGLPPGSPMAGLPGSGGVMQGPPGAMSGGGGGFGGSIRGGPGGPAGGFFGGAPAPGVGPARGAFGGGGGGGFGGGVSTAPADRDRRLDLLERQLSQLMREVRELRREKPADGQTTTPPSPEAPPSAAK